MRPFERKSQARDFETRVNELKKQGIQNSVIAQRLGLRPGSVTNILKRTK